MHENRETSHPPADSAGRPEKADSRTAGAHGGEESDRGIVPVNQPNKEAKRSSAEAGGGKRWTKENLGQPHTATGPNRKHLSKRLHNVRPRANHALRPHP